jgi:hypothetical protein
MFKRVKQPDGLISVLLDRTLRPDERDDAAMDLSAYDEALPILIEAAQNLSEDEMVAESIGESLGEMWKRLGGGFDPTVVARMHPAAQREIGHWFNLD